MAEHASGDPDPNVRDPTTLDDRALIALHADILFTYNAGGRMVRRNELHSHPAPRLLLAQTADTYLLRFGEDLPDVLVARVEDMVDTLWQRGNLRLSESLRSAVRRLLEEFAPITEGGGPIYRFPTSLPALGATVQVIPDNVAIARQTFPWLLDELASWWPCFAAVRAAAAVSLCFSSRIGTSAAEAGVETLPAFRGQGLAPAVTAAWANSIRAEGRIPLYGTSWENLASQAVARRLGLIAVGSDTTWT